LEDLGTEATLVEKNQAIRQRNLEVLLEKPEFLLQEMAARYTVFSRQALEAEILKKATRDERLVEMLRVHFGYV
jgi:hypothetical protein